MSRSSTIPCPSPPEKTLGLRRGYESQAFDIRLITPMIGGGVEPGCNDPTTLIRPSSIRGHLRFWWRATLGARLNSLRELRKKEGEIWGTTSSASQVAVAVQIKELSQPEPCLSYRWNANKRGGNGGYDIVWNPPFNESEEVFPYILFPFQGDDPSSRNQTEPAEKLDRAFFELTVVYPRDCEEDVLTALRAWTNFGGLGARPRRGCGALFCERHAPKNSTKAGLAEWFKTNFAMVSSSSAIDAIPSMDSGPRIRDQALSHTLAWRNAISVFQSFRQEGTGRRPRPRPSQRLSGNNLPGRSYWPEPESLRAIQNKRSDNHQDLGHPEDAFPRAELGLPIIFHFKDRLDPDPGELYPDGANRMASPIIVRPLAFGDGSLSVPMIVCLKAPGPSRLHLKVKDSRSRQITQEKRFGTDSIRCDKFSQYNNSPMKRRSASGSALEAFLAFAREEGFMEVGA